MDAVTLEVLRHALESIADEMGGVLMRTGYSPNIKERRDFSAAVFGADAGLVAQAEHIPVHLGSMPASVRAAIAAFEELGGPRPGDQMLLNDPFAGGTHLNDLTLVAPVCLDGVQVAYVANRAHHTDVGGDAPGSIPVGATDISQEGVRIPPLLLVRDGRMIEGTIRLLLDASRTPGERRGDLLAQIAANERGIARFGELVDRYGADVLAEARVALADYAERRVRAALAAIEDGEWVFSDHLDDDGAGSGPVAITCRLRIEGERVVVDLTDSADQVRGSVNAVASVALSAACYVLRCLIPPDVPVNAGCFRPLEVITRAGSVVAARPPAAVGAGNVEGSQRICDAILGAFQQAAPHLVGAASQGTMNNVLVGGTDSSGQPFSYYETIAGGAGAGPWGPGASGVHTNMTNTRNTPIEALEHAYPFRAVAYELRRGSGGPGRHRGGDGVIREFTVLADDATVTLLGERRSRGPWGAEGGEDGAPGEQWIDGRPVDGKVTLRTDGPVTVRVATPGGGGWGLP